MITSQKVLSADEDKHLMGILKKYQNRDTLILTLLRKYGPRPGELLSLKKRDINFEARTIYFKGLKGSKPREFPLPEDLYLRLRAICVTKMEDDKVFAISKPRLTQIWYEYRPCKKPLRSLRHTAAVAFFKKKRDIQLVQRILGHVKIASTQVYQDFVYSQQELAEVLLD